MLLALPLGAARGQSAESVDYGRDIKPLFSNSCYTCHGPDAAQRQAGLRLDVVREAIDDSGVIVPGDPENSELLVRLASEDPDLRMPPGDSSRPALTPDQVEQVRRWIASGAGYLEHWSYAPLAAPEVPQVQASVWVRNPIDAFVAQRFEQAGVQPAPEADRRTLIRRLSFDLSGLPPKPGDVEAFVADKRPEAYDDLVSRLLASEDYGQRMAAYWLDLVRYADSIGYHSDNPREVSLYRDYVIAAFNANLPFDRFTIEQLAGDLLPDPTREQRIASGYNMLLQTTEEGGAQAKEYLAKYSADRVRNVSEVWLGTTMGCAECHDHKYDPFTAKDFYSLAAFFADLQEPGVGHRTETPVPTADGLARQQELEAAVAAAQQKLDAAGTEAADKAAAELARQRLKTCQDELAAFNKTLPVTLIARSGPPREIRVLPRGDWLDDSGAVVEPAVPEYFGRLPDGAHRPTRLDLARWLVAPQNPLVARTIVNRLWLLFYGAGLARTVEDMGSQGEPPTHPELLDWLARGYIDSGWDTKQLVRLMVTSATYRQSSEPGPGMRQRDPENRLLARQARYRLEAEMVRDAALSVSGLLVDRVGGPSVKPYQPAGYWAHLNFPTREWVQSEGPDVYRRGLYTHWQRTFLHPSLLAFDAPSREECTARRPRSNTPQQALVLLNDPTYVEAARVLAELMLREGGSEDAARVDFAFRQVLSRLPEDGEREILLQLKEQHLQQFRADLSSAEQLLGVGDRPRSSDLDAAQLAAWTSVARVILNLPESIIRY